MENKNHNKILFLIILIIILGLLFLYIFKDSSSEASDSPLSSSLGQESSSEQISSLDISFISSLSLINSIEIDSSFFDNKSFSLLRDNSVSLELVSPGRVNPFSPADLEALNTITEASADDNKKVR